MTSPIDLADLIDGSIITSDELQSMPQHCGSPIDSAAYSRLANECHRLRVENQRMKDVIDTLDCALSAWKAGPGP